MGGTGSASNSEQERSKERMWNPFGLNSLLWRSVSVWASLRPQLRDSRAGIGTGATSWVGRRRLLDESQCRQRPFELGHHSVRGHGREQVERPLRFSDRQHGSCHAGCNMASPSISLTGSNCPDETPQRASSRIFTMVHRFESRLTMPTTTDSPRPFRNSEIARQCPSAKLGYTSIVPITVHPIRGAHVASEPRRPESDGSSRLAAERRCHHRSGRRVIGDRRLVAFTTGTRCFSRATGPS